MSASGLASLTTTISVDWIFFATNTLSRQARVSAAPRYTGMMMSIVVKEITRENSMEFAETRDYKRPLRETREA